MRMRTSLVCLYWHLQTRVISVSSGMKSVLGPRVRTRMLRGRGAGRSGDQKMQEDALSLHLILRIGVVCKDAYTEETGR